MMPVKMRTTISNESQVLKEISKNLMDALKKEGASENVIFDVHVAFEEALRNAMVHGNKSNDQKRVVVEAEVTDKDVNISIEDEGEGFDPDMVPDPTHERNLLKESGRGVYLMKHLMDEVKYENGGRRVVMKKTFKK